VLHERPGGLMMTILSKSLRLRKKFSTAVGNGVQEGRIE
jgi:hypothetical protein